MPYFIFQSINHQIALNIIINTGNHNNSFVVMASSTDNKSLRIQDDTRTEIVSLVQHPHLQSSCCLQFLCWSPALHCLEDQLIPNHLVLLLWLFQQIPPRGTRGKQIPKSTSIKKGKFCRFILCTRYKTEE